MIAAATKAPTNDATIGPAAGATLAAMTPLESLLIAFVGGGLAGALVTGLFALIVESRRHAYQDRTRFIDLKRERFATLLREADEHVRILMRQRAFVQDANRKGIRPEHGPSLVPTDEMSHLAAEIWLLGQKKDVGQAATEVYAAVVALHAFAWDADTVDVNEWIRRSSEHLTTDIAKFEAMRERFLEAAKIDLGTG